MPGSLMKNFALKSQPEVSFVQHSPQWGYGTVVNKSSLPNTCSLRWHLAPWLSKVTDHGLLRCRDPDTEPPAAAADPWRGAPPGLHRPVQRRLSAEHAAGEPAAAQGDFTEKHNHRSNTKHQRPRAWHRRPPHAAQVITTEWSRQIEREKQLTHVLSVLMCQSCCCYDEKTAGVQKVLDWSSQGCHASYHRGTQVMI